MLTTRGTWPLGSQRPEGWTEAELQTSGGWLGAELEDWAGKEPLWGHCGGRLGGGPDMQSHSCGLEAGQMDGVAQEVNRMPGRMDGTAW